MKKKTVGFYGGKFYPIHSGHVFAMTMASTAVDELHIIVSYDDDFEKNVLSKGSKLPHVDYRQRVRWWNEITKHLPHVHVHAVQEKNDGKFESWEAGAKGIREAIGKPIDYVFSSETAYQEFFNKLYPEAFHVVIDEERNKFPISATKLRKEGVYKNWNMLPSVVRRHYVKKVVVVGTESCGKSTLIQNLAMLYNTNYVEEHGRSFYEEMNSYETFKEDYLKIAYRQKYFEEQGLKDANKLLFIDTEAIVTHRFLREYHSREDGTLLSIAEAQKYDLWLLLEPDVEWVDDGTRTLGEHEQRSNGHQMLKDMLDWHGVEYITVKGNYLDRMTQSITHINKLIN